MVERREQTLLADSPQILCYTYLPWWAVSHIQPDNDLVFPASPTVKPGKDLRGWLGDRWGVVGTHHGGERSSMPSEGWAVLLPALVSPSFSFITHLPHYIHLESKTDLKSFLLFVVVSCTDVSFLLWMKSSHICHRTAECHSIKSSGAVGWWQCHYVPLKWRRTYWYLDRSVCSPVSWVWLCVCVWWRGGGLTKR